MKRKPPVPPPVDVRLMNFTATSLLLLFLLMLLAGGALWALRHPLFAIGGITVQGDVTHTNVPTLRAQVAPRVTGNFFTVDLAAARDAFQTVPWVRSAVVRREFPNRLRVSLQEHQPVALWGADGESTLVNSFGEVFEANPGDVEAERLPRLSGPANQSGPVLAMYRTLAPLFAALELEVAELALSARGSWHLELDSGAVVELGRGTPEELTARAERFVRTLTQVTSRHGRRPEALVAADLRHPDGYALRLRGVSTAGADTQRN